MPNKQPPANAQSSTTIPTWHLALEEWEQAPYDGIKGRLPAWIPEPMRKEFGVKQARLFFLVEDKHVRYQAIRERFDWLIATKYGRLVLAMSKDHKPYDDEIDTLVRIYNAVQLGPERGLEKLAGKDAVNGYKSRMASRKRADHAEKQEVQEIGRKLWGEDHSLSIAAIERAPEMRTYRRRYKGRHTLRSWLKEIDPHPELRKPGRPRRSS